MLQVPTSTGNRTSRNDSTTGQDVGAVRYGWDKLGRMLYAATPSGGSSDYYRADGTASQTPSPFAKLTDLPLSLRSKERIEKVANASLSWTQWTRTSGQYDLNLASAPTLGPLAPLRSGKAEGKSCPAPPA